ncbi:uncharacterized protein RAG0_07111 [Rhynchosporium agropyri]|uniref:Zn(2)-C6 fungal-type domain-containing protein n=1 Tax=Rhynchosporium agropyri TaxID=914238 RepID=A0A1E1KJZ0_9HELO|nr:uncharacterized protein RAG0_07111 [Rhynchosporium agropyri]
MVNVGGRSKGYEEQPTCQRCRRSGLECPGPRTTATFIVGKVIKSRRSSKESEKDSDRSSDRGSETDLSPCLSDVPRKLLLSSNDFEIYLCYALKHLRRGDPIELTTRTITSTEMVIAPTVVTIDRGRISKGAVLSFAAIFFGTQHRQAEITRTGFAMYGKVLQRLNESLSDTAHNTNDDLINAVVTLSILELFATTGAGNYLKHMAGLERLFALRDPSLPVSYESAKMYRSVQQMILFAALRSKKASILAQPQWKKRLREHIVSPVEEQKQELFEVLADCTVILSAHEQIVGNFDMTTEINAYKLVKLKQHALNLLSQLLTWKKAWDSDIEQKLTELPFPSDQLDPEVMLLPFTTKLDYSSESIAIAMGLYNISLTHVLQLLALLTSPAAHLICDSTNRPQTPPHPTNDAHFLHDLPHFPNLWSHPPTADQSPPNPYLAAQVASILNIARSVSYNLNTPHRTCSATFHWAAATLWIKVGGDDSVVGRYVWRQLLEKKPMLLETLRTLAA